MSLQRKLIEKMYRERREKRQEFITNLQGKPIESLEKALGIYWELIKKACTKHRDSFRSLLRAYRGSLLGALGAYQERMGRAYSKHRESLRAYEKQIKKAYRQLRRTPKRVLRTYEESLSTTWRELIRNVSGADIIVTNNGFHVSFPS